MTYSNMAARNWARRVIEKVQNFYLRNEMWNKWFENEEPYNWDRMRRMYPVFDVEEH